MDISSEHEEAMRSFKDAYRNLLITMKGMPKDIDISVHLTKESTYIRVVDLKCMVVEPLICCDDESHSRSYTYDENIILQSKPKSEFLPDGSRRKFNY